MDADSLRTYPPLGALKRVTKDVWIVDGPVVRFGPPGLKMAFSTRMTLVRLANGLFVHSPTPLTPDLKAQVEGLADPRWIVGPNRIHYSWIGEWARAYPEAEVYLAPKIPEQAGRGFDVAGRPLVTDRGYPWDEELRTLVVEGSYMSEAIFFHPASRTLVLTDLIENFEPSKIASPAMRLAVRLGGALDPHGGMPRDMRLSYAPKRRQLRAAVETMIDWNPERILLAHGRWYEKDSAAELRRAFAWLL